MSHRHRHLSRKDKKEAVIRKAAILGVFLVTAFLGLLIGNKVLDRYAPQADEPERAVEQGILEIDGVRYRRKPETVTYLLIGEDATGVKAPGTTKIGSGQCDFLQLLVVDRQEKSYTRIPLDRDTICVVRDLTADGRDLGTSTVQLAFAHAKGDGMEMSCENTVLAVSTLFLGAAIDEYVCVNLDAIKIINHELGGVTVTIEDEMNRDDMKVGDTITLTDDQAVAFVRGRKTVADGTNVNRMSRQNQYLTAVTPVLKEKISKDEAFAADLYKALQDYMVTTVSLGDISRLAKTYLDCEDKGSVSISGETYVDRFGYNAFTPSQEDIKKIVTTLLYTPVDG